MADIDKLRDLARKYCQEFYDFSDPVKTKITWGPKKENIKSTDPFKRVELKSNRIAINYTVESDTIFFIDFFKGLLAYHSHNVKPNTWSSWNFFTMAALLLTPSSVLSDSKKSKYAKQWVEIYKSLTNIKVEFNYFRWYRILMPYSRVFVQGLLRNFANTFYNPTSKMTLENQFNLFLQNQNLKFLDKKDIQILTYCLVNQNIEVKELVNQFDTMESTTVYRILKRLNLQLAEYFIPKYLSIGLTNFMLGLPRHTATELREIKFHPFFQRVESYQNISDIFIRMLIPTLNRRLIISQLQSIDKFDNVLERFRNSRVSNIRLDLYDLNKEVWSKEGSTEVISISNEVSYNSEEISEKELFVFRSVIQARTENHLKISSRFSNNETKKIVSRLKKYNIFYKQILWRPPSNFEYYSIIKQIDRTLNRKLIKNEPDSLDRIEWNVKEIENLLIRTLETLPFQFPLVTLEIGTDHINNDLQSCKDIRDLDYLSIIRIAAPKDTIEELNKILGLEKYQGRVRGSPGDMLRLPVEEYSLKSGWNFNVQKLIDIFGD